MNKGDNANQNTPLKSTSNVLLNCTQDIIQLKEDLIVSDSSSGCDSLNQSQYYKYHSELSSPYKKKTIQYPQHMNKNENSSDSQEFLQYMKKKDQQEEQSTDYIQSIFQPSQNDISAPTGFISKLNSLFIDQNQQSTFNLQSLKFVSNLSTDEISIDISRLKSIFFSTTIPSLPDEYQQLLRSASKDQICLISIDSNKQYNNIYIHKNRPFQSILEYLKNHIIQYISYLDAQILLKRDPLMKSIPPFHYQYTKQEQNSHIDSQYLSNIIELFKLLLNHSGNHQQQIIELYQFVQQSLMNSLTSQSIQYLSVYRLSIICITG